jgi:uncharacterized lipoprotein YehR (DUF1307 family)
VGIRRIVSLSVAVTIILSIFLIGCSKENAQTTQSKQNSQGKAVDWKYEAVIKEAIMVTCEKQPVTAGKLSTDRVQISIPANSFDISTELTLENPKSVPQIMSNEFTPIGAPVGITGAGSRLNHPAIITFQMDKTKYNSSIKPGSIGVAYYNGKKWEYFHPDTFDAITGIITFKTYHFSTFAYGMISVEEQIKQYTHSASLASLAQKKVDKLVENLVANVVDMILIDELGWQDKSAKYQIISGLANDVEYRKLIDIFNNRDFEKFNSMLQIYAGKKIAENVDKAAFLSILKGVNKNANAIAAASEVAGYMMEGQYAEAGRILG